MIEIFICEGNMLQREVLTDFIQNYIEVCNLDMKIIISTAEPLEILEYPKKHKGKGLYFLDMDLQTEISGIQLATEIREYDTESAIVFITTHTELMKYIFKYKVEAMGFIEKGSLKELRREVADCIELANKRLTKAGEKNLFQVKCNNIVITEEYENIMFFETSEKKHRVYLHTNNRRVEFYGKLRDIAEMDDCLVQCHRSYVVNKENIAEIDMKKREIAMVNGETCYGSRQFIKRLMSEIKK